MTRKLVLFMTDANAPGWMERQLMPSGSLTSILSQQLWCNDHEPVVGQRLIVNNATGQDAQPVTECSPGDWLVDRVERYPADGNSHYDAVIICHCRYSPVERDWHPVKRGEPITELVAA